jgi:hypothetical protein
MQQIDALLSQFLHGRSLYAPVRRILNLVFAVSLTSYLYIRTHGSYHIFKLSQREEIFNFFTRGEFIIPFSLFVIVYYITQWIPAVVLSAITFWLRARLARVFTHKKMPKRERNSLINSFVKYSRYTPTPLTKAQAHEIMGLFITHVTQDELQLMIKETEAPIKTLEANLILFFRTMLAITVYFVSLPQFGWRLYTLVLVVLICAMILIFCASLVLKVLPPFLQRVRLEMEQYLAERKLSNTSAAIPSS